MSASSKKRDIKSYFSTHYGSGSGSDSDASADEDSAARETGDPRADSNDGVTSEDATSRLVNDLSDDDIMPQMEPKEYHQTLKQRPVDQIQIPDANPGPVDPLVQEKLEKLSYTKETQQLDMKHEIQKRKDFRNPSIYEKLIDHCGIREFGSNFPTDVFDPDDFEPTSYYEELSKAQKVLMDSIADKDKERESHPKVEIVHATAKKAVSSASVTNDPNRKTEHKRISSVLSEPKKKSKWDDAPSVKRPP